MRRTFILASTCGLALWLALPAAAAEPNELDGTWIQILPERPRVGYSLPLSPATLVISGNLIEEKVGDRACRQSLFTRVPGRRPNAIDLMTVVGGEFWLTRAIYKIEGDTLTICESTRDKQRPADFRPWTGIEVEVTQLTTYKRQVAPPKVK
jgi:uncharacterized protein (TIGR03067 family)